MLKISDIQEKDRYNIVLANPPFGGKERAEVQQNFPIKPGETAFLFFQHFIKSLKAGGRAAIVIKNTFLSNSDNASVSCGASCLTSCNLFTVLDMPGGTFQGAGIKTVVLFFEKGAPTRKIWFYKLDGPHVRQDDGAQRRRFGRFCRSPGGFRGQRQFVEAWTPRPLTPRPMTFRRKIRTGRKRRPRDSREIMEEIAALDAESAEILADIRGLL